MDWLVPEDGDKPGAPPKAWRVSPSLREHFAEHRKQAQAARAEMHAILKAGGSRRALIPCTRLCSATKLRAKPAVPTFSSGLARKAVPFRIQTEHDGRPRIVVCSTMILSRCRCEVCGSDRVLAGNVRRRRRMWFRSRRKVA